MYRYLIDVSISHFLILSSLIFVVGLFGLCKNRKSLINSLMSIELMLLGININFVAFSSYYGNINGQVFTIFVLTVAAAESAIGLAIILNYFRNRKTIDVDNINLIRE